MVGMLLEPLGIDAPQLLLLLIPLLPLAAGLIAHLLLRRWAAASAGLGVAALLGSAALGLQLLSSQLAPESHPVRWSHPWVSLSELDVPLALSAGLAQLMFAATAALLAVAVLVYAVRDRQGDPRAGAFHANLTLFAGSMLLLLCADTLLLLYIAWELLGLFSFILIAHTGTDEAKRAAKQAFWTTRATDFGLLFAILIMLTSFGWPTLSSINVGMLLQQIVQAAGPDHALGVIYGAYALLSGVLLLVLLAVIGKSAQWPLSFWLADAMVAPAPVSALLHAATLVAAGPYLLFMLRPLFLPRLLSGGDGAVFIAPQLALLLVTLTGGVTLVLGGLMALFAREPKRVLAYSTISQLGLCLCGIGLLAERAAFFQLLAHAWCKAALFLAVGVLVARHAARHSADGASGHSGASLAELAGSARGAAAVRWTLAVAGAALAGIPLLGPALAKEELLASALTRLAATPQGFPESLGSAYPLAAIGWRIACWLLILSLPLTAAYMTRLVVQLGFRSPADTADSPAGHDGWQAGSIAMLAAGLAGAFGMSAVYGPFRAYFSAPESAWQWSSGHGLLPLLLSLAGLALGGFLGWRMLPSGSEAPARGNAAVEFLAHGMYLREFWHRTAASAGWWLAVLAGRTETKVVDALAERTGRFGRLLAAASAWFDLHVVDGLRWQACEMWWRIRRIHGRYFQNGDIQHYMLVILLSAVVLCLVVARPLSHIFARVINRL